MHRDVVAFVGPSIPLPEARAILDVDYRGPAAMGDVFRAACARPRAILLVDGVFERVPSVWHKEVLFALSEGIHVAGSSSMGALRAAELCDFGMVGIGQVFEMYRSGALEDDDEVAVAHADEAHAYRALSDPMVNIREGARVAVERGLIPPAVGAQIVSRAKASFYPDRSWRAEIDTVLEVDPPAGKALAAEMPNAPDLKRADAAALLRYAKERFLDAPPFVPAFDLEVSSYFKAVVEEETAIVDGSPAITRWDLARHVHLTRRDAGRVRRDALHDLLVLDAAERMGLVPQGAACGGTLARRLASMRSGTEMADAVDDLAVQLVTKLGASIAPLYVAALARRGEEHLAIDEVRKKWTRLRARGIERPDAAALEIDLDELGTWYERRFASLDGGAEAHAKALGFQGWSEFMAELVAEYLVREEDG